MSAPFGAPRVGVGAVVIHEGRVVLIRRGKDPLRGRWVIPGGTVEAGETLHEALVREVQEETGLTVRPRDVVLVFDRILREDGELRYHYVIVDYLCEYVSGTPCAGTDAEAVAQALAVVLDGFRRQGIPVDVALAPGASGE